MESPCRVNNKSMYFYLILIEAPCRVINKPMYFYLPWLVLPCYLRSYCSSGFGFSDCPSISYLCERTKWPKWSGGPEGHFGCKWLSWGSPARAPLATHVALSRAFMPVSSPRIHVQLCTSAYSCTSSDSTPKYGCHRSLRKSLQA